MSGIVRKIDELGRIVIPKEIRKVMHLKVGSSLEIIMESETQLILRSFNALENAMSGYTNIVEALSKNLNAPVILTNTNKIVDCIKLTKSNFTDLGMLKKLDNILESRSFTVLKHTSLADLFKNTKETVTNSSVLILPLLSESTLIGSIIVLLNSEVDIVLAEKLLKFSASVIGNN